MAVNVLGLRNHVDGPFVAVVPVVDGVSLVDLVGAFETSRGYDLPGSYAGLARGEDFDPALWRPTRRGRRRTTVLGCECGQAACWPLRTRIRTVGHQVMWDSFDQPHRPDRDYSGFGSFTFDAGQYSAALADPAGRRRG
ncbi:hypothetical protein SAMN05660199_01003 [Klenkia soli]|uniref:Uncharacterized protein n=1 Tax=Klenkia soli TaxID=1052260 RepID=A0A1H0FRZ8_9ACTN|nr:hypothetical protein [Klenkia soli]SDN97417.1 hypothetical protein SAMN05660199_01003 [Klenkia soli]